MDPVTRGGNERVAPNAGIASITGGVGHVLGAILTADRAPRSGTRGDATVTLVNSSVIYFFHEWIPSLHEEDSVKFTGIAKGIPQ